MRRAQALRRSSHSARSHDTVRCSAYERTMFRERLGSEVSSLHRALKGNLAKRGKRGVQVRTGAGGRGEYSPQRRCPGGYLLISSIGRHRFDGVTGSACEDHVVPHRSTERQAARARKGRDPLKRITRAMEHPCQARWCSRWRDIAELSGVCLLSFASLGRSLVRHALGNSCTPICPMHAVRIGCIAQQCICACSEQRYQGPARRRDALWPPSVATDYTSSFYMTNHGSPNCLGASHTSSNESLRRLVPISVVSAALAPSYRGRFSRGLIFS